MGLTAQYVPVDDQTLAELLTLTGDALCSSLRSSTPSISSVEQASLLAARFSRVYDRYVEIEDDLYGTPGHYDMDTGWDGLHFLLTGTSAWSPADDPLSEAVLGVHQVCDDPWISCTKADELVLRVAALRAVDLDGMLRAVDFQAFTDHGIYPAVWSDDPARLRSGLATHFYGLLTAYEAVLGTGQHVLVQIG